MKTKLSTKIELRFSDMDMYGHVNNAVIFTFLETARTKVLLKEFLDCMDNDISFLVVHASCDYKAPIVLSDTLIVDMTLSSKGKTSFIVDYLLHDGTGKIFAEAKTIMVTFDSIKKKPVRIPESILAIFV